MNESTQINSTLSHRDVQEISLKVTHKTSAYVKNKNIRSKLNNLNPKP